MDDDHLQDLRKYSFFQSFNSTVGNVSPYDDAGGVGLMPEQVGLPNTNLLYQALNSPHFVPDYTHYTLWAAHILYEDMVNLPEDDIEKMMCAALLSGTPDVNMLSVDFETPIIALLAEADIVNTVLSSKKPPMFTQFSRDAAHIVIAFEITLMNTLSNPLRTKAANFKGDIFSVSANEITAVAKDIEPLLVDRFVNSFNELAMRYDSPVFLTMSKKTNTVEQKYAVKSIRSHHFQHNSYSNNI